MQVESSATPLLTIDEANESSKEDTISAFEETDAAVDVSVDSVSFTHR